MTPDKEPTNQEASLDLALTGGSAESSTVASTRSAAAVSDADSSNRDSLVSAVGNGETDENLMLAYASGDVSAFETLYRKYRPALFRFFLAAVADESLANELYQETWTKVIGASRKYQPKAAFSTWLFTIARNNLWDYFRRFQPRLVEFDTVAELGGESGMAAESGNTELQPEELAALTQQAQTLQQALDKLPLKQKEVMLLRYVAGMTLSEIATSIEEKPETVKSRLRYATAKLKNDLKHSLAGFQRLA